jgi:Xaa-Pro aminopeptidase
MNWRLMKDLVLDRRWTLGFLVLLVVNDSGGLPSVAPYGGAARFFSTNPLAAGIPRGQAEPIIIDMGAYVDGYCGDLTRTVWVGEPEPKLREIYQIVYNAIEAAEAGIKAGMTGKEADTIARDIIEEAGYGDQFIHSLGHGLGVRVHEGPSLTPRNDSPLEPGNVVTIEPGIYIPGWGGVRIEDVARITEDGVDIFTAAPKRSV